MADIKVKYIKSIRENKKSLPQSEVLIIIPAYNEAENIERVVDELKDHFPKLDYIVVTDGPTDGTDTICRNRGYNMIELPENMGLSKCFRTGMMYALKNEYKYAVQLDGDGQHRPEYILSMKSKADEGYDIVMGSRFLKRNEKTKLSESFDQEKRETNPLGYSDQEKRETNPLENSDQKKSEMKSFGVSDQENRMPLMRRLGSFMIRSLILAKTGVLLTDPTCGMRLYDSKIMEMFALHEGLSPEPDTIAFLIKRGAKVAEVPVKVIERTAGNSYLSPVKALKYMHRTLMAIMKVK